MIPPRAFTTPVRNSLARSGRAGRRSADLERPRHPSPEEATQSNDIGMDQDGRLYLIDRWGAGMPILEYTG
jgi:hypothetical protein